MRRRHTGVVLGLIMSMCTLTWGQSFATDQDSQALHLQTIQLQAERWGVGSEVMIKLAGGAKLRGRILEINDGGIVIKRGSNTTAVLDYHQIAQIRLARLVYRADGKPDPIAARRVVEGLGLGHHIAVKTIEAREFHGNIQSIESDHFVLVPDQQMAPVEIAFGQVNYVEQNLSTASKIALVAVAAVIAVVVIVVVSQRGKIGF